MYRNNYLFFIVFLAAFSSGCATHAPAPVEDARPQAPESAPAVAATVTRPAAIAPRASNTASTGSTASAAAIPVSLQAAPQATARSPEMLFAALAAAGFDYKRGGKSMTSGFDCSGLVAHVFKEAYGVLLPHNAAAQSAHGKTIARAELEPGDLVFFNTEQRPYSHVGIYLGDNRFIHAPKPGAVVRTENMKLSYWQKRYDGGRRIVE